MFIASLFLLVVVVTVAVMVAKKASTGSIYLALFVFVGLVLLMMLLASTGYCTSAAARVVFAGQGHESTTNICEPRWFSGDGGGGGVGGGEGRSIFGDKMAQKKLIFLLRFCFLQQMWCPRLLVVHPTPGHVL